MAAIDEAETVIDNAGRLLAAARQLDVPVLQTEQYPSGLGATVPELAPPAGAPAIEKMTFDACGAVVDALSPGQAVVVAGCEAHVCVLQTVLNLREQGRDVYVVADAVGSRRPASKEAALRRMERHGADIVTTEMVLFEWLETAEHPEFKSVTALIK
jgi:nicotinamidase-related amidase